MVKIDLSTLIVSRNYVIHQNSVYISIPYSKFNKIPQRILIQLRIAIERAIRSRTVKIDNI